MSKAEKTTSNEGSTAERSASSFSVMRKGIRQMTQRGVEFEVSANGSLRVRPSSYSKYLELEPKTK